MWRSGCSNHFWLAKLNLIDYRKCAQNILMKSLFEIVQLTDFWPHTFQTVHFIYINLNSYLNFVVKMISTEITTVYWDLNISFCYQSKHSIASFMMEIFVSMSKVNFKKRKSIEHKHRTGVRRFRWNYVATNQRIWKITTNDSHIWRWFQ